MRPAGNPFSQRGDTARWLGWRRALADVAAEPEPAARLFLTGADTPVEGSLAVLPGSFNPVTLAHVALAGSALAAGGCGRLVFSLSTRIIDKEQVTGLTLEDRLVLLSRLVEAEADERLGIAVCNRGLYVEQATAFRRAAPALTALWFVVGWDKIVQVFDRRYYPEGDAALDHLFAGAGFLVAPRADGDAGALAALLTRPENARYADQVRPIDLAPRWRDLSATRVRAALAAGAPADADLPAPVGERLVRWGVFAPNGRAYARRCARLAAIASANLGPLVGTEPEPTAPPA